MKYPKTEPGVTLLANVSRMLGELGQHYGALYQIIIENIVDLEETAEGHKQAYDRLIERSMFYCLTCKYSDYHIGQDPCQNCKDGCYWKSAKGDADGTLKNTCSDCKYLDSSYDDAICNTCPPGFGNWQQCDNRFYRYDKADLDPNEIKTPHVCSTCKYSEYNTGQYPCKNCDDGCYWKSSYKGDE